MAVQSIQQIVAARSFDLVLKSNPTTLYRPDVLRATVQELLRRTDGVIWIAPHFEEPVQPPDLTTDAARRLVLVNLVFATDDRFTSVVADFEGAAAALTTRLIARGCRRIGYVGGSRERRFAHLRLRGFRKAMQAAGVPLDDRRIAAFLEDFGETSVVPAVSDALDAQAAERYHRANMRSGQTAIRAILAHGGEPPDAVFAATDCLALGVLDGLKEAGLRVPEDVAVVGFDDYPAAHHCSPSLTTAHMPYAEQGSQAAHLLLAQLAGDMAPGGRHILPCRIIGRESG